MNRIIFPLEAGRQGPEVADLQVALQLLLDRGAILRDDEGARRELYAELERERAERVYGDVTIKVVATFQEERRLDPSGNVDEPTASEINAFLQERGLLDQHAQEQLLVVSGHVRRNDDLPLEDGLVRAFHESERGVLRLGEDTTDAQGRYTIRYERLPEMSSVDLLVEAYDEDGTRLQSSEVIREAGPLEIVDLVVPVTSRPSERRRLEGHVVLDNGPPAENLILRLYRLDFGGVETRLGETTTRELGLYVLPFDLGGEAAGIEVRAVDAAGSETTLSKPMYDLGNEARTVANLVAPATLQPLAAEYQRLAADLTPHVGGMEALAGAHENAERQDLTVLNRATGWDARLIALAANAEKLSADPEVRLPQEAVYGLLRAGLPSDKLHLAQVSAEAVEQALTKIREAGIVGLSDAQVAEIKMQFETFADKTRLAVPAPGSRSTYGALLDNSGLDEDARKKFASVYLNHSRDADLWKNARDAGLNDGQIQTLQLQGKLAFLAGNSEAMTVRLMERQMTDPAQLVEQDFYRAEQWEAEVKRAAGVSPDVTIEQLSADDKEKLEALIPLAYAGETLGERLNAYTKDMARKVRFGYPTQVVGRMVEQDDADEFRLGEAHVATATLLKNAAAEGFRLGQTPVETFVEANPGVLDGIDNIESAKQNVKTLQRVYQVTPSDEAMPVLMKLGLTSAYDIVALSQETFLDRFGHKFPSIEQARLVYRKAQQVSSVTYNLFTIAKKLDSEAPVYGMSAPAEVRESVRNELIKQFPTLESLFGSMDFCECEHCRSVLSPAAYLVDLLQFVDAEPEVWDNFLAHWKDTHNDQDYTARYKKPYDALVERRPDIPHIPLTCENTHTALPYIDVVNEILEYYVANEELTEDAARDTGEATTTELLAEPQNVISEAYDKIRQASYPLNLPFDLWLETVRSFCDYFETPLWRLLETFRPGDELFVPAQPYDREAIFIESLGLSPAEYAVFTDPDPLEDDKWYDLYGYTTARPAIGNPTNTENATLTIPDADADKFRVGDQCTYFDVSANALHEETKTIREIGAAGSGGSDQTTIEFVGIWENAPEAGDLLVFDAPAVLKSAKALSRRLGVTYKEIVEIVQTGFVNPELAKLVILYKLGVTIQDVMFYKDHKTFYDLNEDLLGKDRNSLSAADQQRFDDLSKTNPTTKKTGWEDLHEVQGFEQRLKNLGEEFDVPLAQLEGELQAIPFDDVLVLADPDAGCNFDLTTLRYANGDPADAIAFLRINLLVRLWRKLRWTIEETDRALQAFVPENTPFEAANLDKQPLRTALIYVAHLKRLGEQVRVGEQSRLKLLTLWSDLSANGEKPLYAQLFLTRSVLKSGEVFDDVAEKYLSVFDDPLGKYLSTADLAAMAERIKHEVSKWNVKDAEKIDPADLAGEPRVSLRYDALQEVQYLAYRGVLTDADKAQLAGLSSSPALTPLLDTVQSKAREFTLIKGHLLALQGALGLTADEIGRILTDTDKDLATAELSLDTVSLLYRYGLLARALGLSIHELIVLKQLSGLDPFKPLHPDPRSTPDGDHTLDKDYPFIQTLRFVEVAEQVKDSGLKIEDLDYLLRHRFDETGKYAPDNDATLALMKTLAEGIRAIRAEHALPADPGTMGEEMLRQKLGLTSPPDVVERFLAMLNGTVEFTATKTGVSSADKLVQETFEDEPSIRGVSYKEVPHEEQKLTLRGVLFQTEKDRLKDQFSSPVLADLLADLEKQARLFFENNLRKQKLRLDDEAGFLEKGDFKKLFEPLKPLLKIASGDTQRQINNKLKKNEKIEQENQAKLQGRRYRIAKAFLPFLQQRLIRQFIVKTMTAQLGADPALVEALLSDTRLLGDPQPLVAAFTATSERGVNATFFDGADTELGAEKLFADVDTALKGKEGDPLKPASANRARLVGYLEAPTPGAYRFYVAFEKKDAEAELRFDHLPQVFLGGTAANDGAEVSEYLELKPGVPYRFTLDVKKLNGGDVRLLVQGETLPKDKVAQLTLYPQTAIERADHALVLLRKVLQLIQSSNLTEREVRYLLTHAVDFGGLDLSNLPAHAGDDAPAGARALFAQFLRVACYARLKRDLAGGTDDLIGIFETTSIDQVYPLIARLTRREETTVKATASALFTAPSFKNELTLQRVWEALQVVERFGVPLASMVGWTRIVSAVAAPDQRFAIARDLKEAIKARFEPETWQRVAQPIFDKLRQRQRDALVAHVMHQRGFARMEQLYEYFLIDPGMEPVVQTSRIRLAISSLQLFIQRCLINLEKDVPPSVINARQWEWMKRYRVWEVNRKIFLFPENWLEPEFRDDKTHLFSELEGNLLQGDVSNDLVEDAFLNYLKKLEELARLDIVAMHLEDKDDPALRTLHVIGRTYSEPHEYFYRRYAHQMWTPWEPVTAEIEGDHLAPVVWRDRLYLFWVTFLEKAAQDNSDRKFDPTKEITISTDVRRKVDVQLHWSEYLQGEWSTRESSGFMPVMVKTWIPPHWERPKVGDTRPIASNGYVWVEATESSAPLTVSLSFDYKSVFIHVSKEPFENGEVRGVYVNLGDPINQAFYLAGRNSILEKASYSAAPAMPYSNSGVHASRYSGSGPLQVTFKRRVITEDGKAPVGPPETPSILGQGGSYGSYTLLPCDNDIEIGAPTRESLDADDPAMVADAIERGLPEIASLMKPLFYQDNAHTLFVEPNVEERTIEEWQEWVTRTPQPEPEWVPWDRLEEFVKPMIPKLDLPILIYPDDPIWHLSANLDSRITVKPGQDWLVNPATGLLFEGELIGPGGKAGMAVLSSTELAGAIAEGGTPVNVHAGSGLASGSTVVALASDALDRAGLAQTTGTLNIVGGSGFNSALAQNFNALNRSGFGAGNTGGESIGR
ncbi:MAG: neuraminidase-like domain-containing protein [Rubrobacteraceae bacterium]